MRDETEKLPGRQGRALAALLNNPTVRDAAKAARLSEATLYRYMRDAAFAARLKDARRGLIDQLTTRLQSKMDSAAQALTDIAEDKAAPASVRVSAAKAVIEFGLKAFELGDLEDRIKAVEKMQQAQQKGGRR